MSEYSKNGADVVNYKGRLNLSPTQTPEGWGYPGADTMRFNRPVLFERGYLMIWGIICGFVAGAVFGMFLACLMFTRKDD